MATLTIPSGIEQLTHVNAFLRKSIPTAFKKRIHLIELAVEEILVNIFRYAYHNGNGNAEVSCQFVKHNEISYFVITIKDWGEPFDPFQVPLPDLSLDINSRPIGGLGVHLVRTAVDLYKYKRESDINVVELFFQFLAEGVGNNDISI